MRCPRHAGSPASNSPGFSLEISIRTGAPNARALALGFQDWTNGTAAPTAPTAATPDVASSKYRRVTGLEPESVNAVDSPYFLVCYRQVATRGKYEKYPMPMARWQIIVSSIVGVCEPYEALLSYALLLDRRESRIPHA